MTGLISNICRDKQKPMTNLRIDNPCPMLLSRMSKTDSGFSCKSCKREVIDFRDKTPEEIATAITADTCGIFNNSQLAAAPKHSLFRKGIFAALTVLSFLGFNVSPVNAAPVRSSGAMITQSGAGQDEKENASLSKKTSGSAAKPKPKKKSHKKTKEFKTIGCPSF
jgi:hypothetical protein